MDSNVCVTCNTEKSNDNFYNKYRECKHGFIIRRMKRYYEKLCYEKIEMCYLQSLN